LKEKNRKEAEKLKRKRKHLRYDRVSGATQKFR
jgi:predicted site-specific integrase-resolvase